MLALAGPPLSAHWVAALPAFLFAPLLAWLIRTETPRRAALLGLAAVFGVVPLLGLASLLGAAALVAFGEPAQADLLMAQAATSAEDWLGVAACLR